MNHTNRVLSFAFYWRTVSDTTKMEDDDVVYGNIIVMSENITKQNSYCGEEREKKCTQRRE